MQAEERVRAARFEQHFGARLDALRAGAAALQAACSEAGRRLIAHILSMEWVCEFGRRPPLTQLTLASGIPAKHLRHRHVGR